MANTQPGPDQQPPQQEGPRTSMIILGFAIAALLLFAVFFTWYQNTK